MVIDLHGLPHQTAIKVVEDRLIQASNKGSFDAEIITGKSVIMQRCIVNEVLDSWGFDYVCFDDNPGTIYVSYTPL
jgi:DNA-nicking Smr family endonuclease